MAQDAGRVVVGRYRLIGLLGEGGMGAAWRAHDERMGRDVVLKQLKLPAGLDAGLRGQLVARMEREARAAGMLKHPSIVTVHDQFHDEDGLPWIVMELVDGRSLAEAGPLPETEVARIGAEIAAALAVAHEAGVVHRDIKPANVLLEGDRVVVTDFGISTVSGEITLTPHGALIGTPAYMAPEQVNDREATPASDMWSLGATLYTVLEGRPPFTGSTTAALLLAVSQGKPAPALRARLLKPVLRDLMRISPVRRPTAVQAAAALATLRPSPATEPDLAGAFPSALAGPKRRLSRRAAIVALGGLATAAPAGYFLTRDNDTLSRSNTTPSSPSPPAFPRWNRTPIPLGKPLTGHTNTVFSVVFSPDGKTLATTSFDKTVRLWDVASRTAIGRPLTGHIASVFSAAFSPDGKTLATTSEDKTVRLWDVASQTLIGRPLTGHTGSVYSAAFSPDGKTVATSSQDKTVRLWDVASRTLIGRPLTGHTDLVWSVVFSPDGKSLATGSGDDTVRLWDVASQTLIGRPLTGHTGLVWSVVFSPDGKSLATCSADNTVRLWDVASRTPIGRPLNGHTSWIYSVAFSPDGKTLATGSYDKTVRLWDVASRTQIGSPLTDHAKRVLSVEFSPDGKILATSGDDKKVRLWRP